MVLIYCDSRILKQSDRNKTSSFRELLALLFGIIQMESQIRGHSCEVVILTDCISLSLIHKQNYHNSKLLEISIFLASFGNISIQYVQGPSLFFADLISILNLKFLRNLVSFCLLWIKSMHGQG